MLCGHLGVFIRDGRGEKKINKRINKKARGGGKKKGKIKAIRCLEGERMEVRAPRAQEEGEALISTAKRKITAIN